MKRWRTTTHLNLAYWVAIAASAVMNFKGYNDAGNAVWWLAIEVQLGHMVVVSLVFLRSFRNTRKFLAKVNAVDAAVKAGSITHLEALKQMQALSRESEKLR